MNINKYKKLNITEHKHEHYYKYKKTEQQFYDREQNT